MFSRFDKARCGNAEPGLSTGPLQGVRQQGNATLSDLFQSWLYTHETRNQTVVTSRNIKEKRLPRIAYFADTLRVSWYFGARFL